MAKIKQRSENKWQKMPPHDFVWARQMHDMCHNNQSFTSLVTGVLLCLVRGSALVPASTASESCWRRICFSGGNRAPHSDCFLGVANTLTYLLTHFLTTPAIHTPFSNHDIMFSVSSRAVWTDGVDTGDYEPESNSKTKTMACQYGIFQLITELHLHAALTCIHYKRALSPSQHHTM